MPFHCTSPDSLYFILIQYNVNLNFTSTELILCKNYFPYTKRRRVKPRLPIDNPYNIFKAQLRQRQAPLLFRQMRYLSADCVSRHTH